MAQTKLALVGAALVDAAPGAAGTPPEPPAAASPAREYLGKVRERRDHAGAALGAAVAAHQKVEKLLSGPAHQHPVINSRRRSCAAP